VVTRFDFDTFAKKFKVRGRFVACLFLAATTLGAAQTQIVSNYFSQLAIGSISFGTNMIMTVNSTADLPAGGSPYATARFTWSPTTLDGTSVQTIIEALVTNLGTSIQSTGHLIGVFGHGTDNTGGRASIYGVEGRVDGRSTNASGTHSYVGVGGRAMFQGTDTPNTVWFIAHDAQVSITTDGSTPLAKGIAVGYYMPTIVGGNTKYAYYAQTDPIFAGGGIDSAGTDIAASGLISFMSGSPVASAGTITLSGNLFHVTGTTTITSVSGASVPAGTCIRIIFDGVLTFTDGSNLKLAGNFVTTADDTISLCYDGSNWYEMGRAVN
jgi:hypothetical protein